MNIRFYFLILLFSLTTTYSFAKPICKNLYDRIYNDADFYDVSIPTHKNKKTIGIRLLKEWNANRIIELPSGEKFTLPGYELAKNIDGYYIVGKITDEKLYKFSQVEVGDIVLSINNIDLRLITDFKKRMKLENDVSDLFETNELIKYVLLKKDKNKFKKIVVDRTASKESQSSESLTNIALKVMLGSTDKNKFKKIVPGRTESENSEPNIRNTLNDFNSPFIDFFVKSLSINEKDGTFTASIERNFLTEVDERHSLTKIINEELIKNKKYKDGRLTNFRWYQCDYSEKEWEDLDSISLIYGMQFDKLVRQDNDLKSSSYNIKPEWKRNYKSIKNTDEPNYLFNEAQLQYISTGVYTFQSNFNLKTFPFDKQKIRIFLYNNKQDINNYRALISSVSSVEAEQFAKRNIIPGWNIDKVNLNYDLYVDENPKYAPKSNNDSGLYDGISYEVEISRKSGYYIFKIIFPILLILMICWSAVWIDPKEIESRLTITIVCLLSLIAYNFVIDSDLPKLEYLTIMDYIILISYIYAAIPNFLSIYSFQLLKKNKALTKKYEFYEKRYGLPSYVLIIFLIIIINASSAPEHTNSMFTWAAMR